MSNNNKKINDGSKNSFYAIPAWVEDLDDLSEYLKLDGFEFNLLKTLWVNMGDRHTGTNEAREINKRVHYANKSKTKHTRSLKAHNAHKKNKKKNHTSN